MTDDRRHRNSAARPKRIAPARPGGAGRQWCARRSTPRHADLSDRRRHEPRLRPAADARRASGLSLAGLNRVVDYPARDMTITVEAGITHGRAWPTCWPPSGNGCRSTCRTPTEATLGGVVATALSGPRRYGHGTMRDYVIGISAVDGRGMPFKAGGRVVKNVAGYDFCKLLTGSLGTLGVITQVTLKIKPRPEASALASATLRDLDTAERLLAALVDFGHHARRRSSWWPARPGATTPRWAGAGRLGGPTGRRPGRHGRPKSIG